MWMLWFMLECPFTLEGKCTGSMKFDCSLSAKEIEEFGNMLILTIGQKGRSNLNAVLFSTL